MGIFQEKVQIKKSGKDLKDFFALTETPCRRYWKIPMSNFDKIWVRILLVILSVWAFWITAQFRNNEFNIKSIQAQIGIPVPDLKGEISK